jgi:NAD(P)-dependent dehydrogenase (short-subunit alcohol dehydrogenase family)
MKNLTVILGGSVGVGAAIAKRIAGPTVVFHRGRHPEGIERVTDVGWPEMRFVELDVGRDRNAVLLGINAVQHLLQEWELPAVGTLVHSLSGASVTNTLRTSLTQLERTFNNLAHSFFWWTQELVEHKMLAPNARILALSNPCVEFYLSNSGVISAAKAALEAYVRMLAVELGPSGAKVNAVRFGAVVTPALQAVLGPQAVERLCALHHKLMPSGLMQTPDEIAKSIMVLLRDEFTAANGAVLDLDGGSVLKLMDYAFSEKS